MLARTGVLVGSLAATALILSPAAARAHALLTAPVPRDASDSHKDPNGPCGVVRSAAQPRVSLAPGARSSVTWTETIDHPGCFVVDFAAAGDAGWVTLGTAAHDGSGSTPRSYSLDVTLPSSECQDCTLRLRQLMLSSEVPANACPPADVAAGQTYYSCANVTLAATGAAGAAGAGPAPAESGGCAIARVRGVASGAVLALLLASAGAWVARRHRSAAFEPGRDGRR